eukprot:975285_1
MVILISTLRMISFDSSYSDHCDHLIRILTLIANNTSSCNDRSLILISIVNYTHAHDSYLLYDFVLVIVTHLSILHCDMHNCKDSKTQQRQVYITNCALFYGWLCSAS